MTPSADPPGEYRVSEELLRILACPVCKVHVDLKDDDRLVCGACHRVYRIEDGIPVMLIEEATFEPGYEPEAEEPEPDGDR